MSSGTLRNCMACGALFLHIVGSPLCGKCQVEMEDVYQKARRFLRKAKPGDRYDGIELAEILDVEPIFIHILIQEGRLEQEGAPLHDPEAERKKVLAHLFSDEADRLREKRESVQETKRTGGSMFISERNKNR